MARKKDDGLPAQPVVRVAPLGELKAYTVSEHELDRLARGAAVSDLLTIGYALLSVGATLVVTLLSTTLGQVQLLLFFSSFLIFTIAGVICLIIGYKTRESIQALLRDVKSRMPPPAIRQSLVLERIEIREHGTVERIEPETMGPPPAPDTQQP